MVGQDAVFAHDGDDIRRDAYGAQVQQGNELAKFDAVALGERLHEFEAHPATGQVGIGIGGVEPLGVQDGRGGRKHLVGHVVVADDEVDAFFTGVSYFFDRFDAAVEHDDEFHPCLIRIIHSFERHSIAFFVAVGDIIVDVGIVLLQELVNQCHGRAAIDIIVSIHHNPFFPSQRFIQPLHGFVHVLEQERVVQLCQGRAEEFPCSCGGRDAAVYQELAKYGADVQLIGKPVSRFLFFRCRSF